MHSPTTHIDAAKRARGNGNYTEQERERALVAVALASGNARRAARTLRQQGFPVPARTLQRWKREHHELYARVESEVLPRVKRKLAAEYTDLARYELAVSRKVLERLDAEAGDPDKLATRDLPGALRNIKVSAAVGTDKSQLLRDSPTEIKQTMSVAESLRELQRLGAIDGTATEESVQDAQVIENPELPEGGD
jgi:hypothetical protein